MALSYEIQQSENAVQSKLSNLNSAGWSQSNAIHESARAIARAEILKMIRSGELARLLAEDGGMFKFMAQAAANHEE